MTHYNLTCKRVSHFIDVITRHHYEPFTVEYWVEDFDSFVINQIAISPMLAECRVTHCYNVKDPRFKCLPLGVKFHAKDIIGDFKYQGEKKLLLICMSENTNPQRKLFPDWSLDKDWVTFQYSTEPEHYFILLQQHHFCVCPSGYSIDTYRFWECLGNNVIPIVDTDYYNQFPEIQGKYLKVDNFFDLTETFLLEKLKDYR
jgi:hypothetical protein